MITGANKGIGLATATAILEAYKDVSILLGSRDVSRGEAAMASLCQRQGDWQARLSVLEIDVADDDSVLNARDTVLNRLGPQPLYGIVNNAGTGFGSTNMASVLAVNTLGVKRVCDAFIPLIVDAGRVVNVASASGPNFVSQCSPSMQHFFRDPDLAWSDVADLISDVLQTQDHPERLQEKGLGKCDAYGFSKACVSLYTLILARQTPRLIVNACTPGYIETDLTRPLAESRGLSPAAMGMKPPAEGTRAILFLLFGQPEGSGHFYGSDAKRSPLDRYREPGSPAYRGV